MNVRHKVTSIAVASLLATMGLMPGASASTSAFVPTATTSTEDIQRFAARVIEDISELDIRVQDGIGMSSRLVMLAHEYTNLFDAAVPAGADPAKYKARCATLADFASRAADDYTNGDGLSGSAKYAVLRQETAPLLAAINAGLGTTYVLPSSTAPTPSPSTTAPTPSPSGTGSPPSCSGITTTMRTPVSISARTADLIELTWQQDPRVGNYIARLATSRLDNGYPNYFVNKDLGRTTVFQVRAADVNGANSFIVSIVATDCGGKWEIGRFSTAFLTPTSPSTTTPTATPTTPTTTPTQTPAITQARAFVIATATSNDQVTVTWSACRQPCAFTLQLSAPGPGYREPYLVRQMGVATSAVLARGDLRGASTAIADVIVTSGPHRSPWGATVVRFAPANMSKAKFLTCTSLRRVFPAGVAESAAAARRAVQAGASRPAVRPAVYTASARRLDRDADGLMCLPASR